jgi:hypothetical protein
MAEAVSDAGSGRWHRPPPSCLVTNLDWDEAKLLNWHREKAGTVGHVQDEVKNALEASSANGAGWPDWDSVRRID